MNGFVLNRWQAISFASDGKVQWYIYEHFFYQKQVSQAGISNYIPQFTFSWIGDKPSVLPVMAKFSGTYMSTFSPEAGISGRDK